MTWLPGCGGARSVGDMTERGGHEQDLEGLPHEAESLCLPLLLLRPLLEESSG